MTNLLLIGMMVVSTGALMSTGLRGNRAMHVLLWALLAAEAALFATLVTVESVGTLWWCSVVLVVMAGANLTLWVLSVIQSMNSSPEES